MWTREELIDLLQGAMKQAHEDRPEFCTLDQDMALQFGALADKVLALTKDAAREAWVSSAKQNWLCGNAEAIERQWERSTMCAKWSKP